MHELLLEFYSEEIPQTIQQLAAESFYNIFKKKFIKSELEFTNLQVYVGPCRLTIYTEFVNQFLPKKKLLLKGPRVGADKNNIEGFCRSHSISFKNLTIDQEGQFYFYEKYIPPQDIREVLPEIITSAIKEYVWPKSMRWGSNKITWVRPLKNILSLFSGEELVIEYGHLISNSYTYGHKFLAYKREKVSSWYEYTRFLQSNFVILEQNRRKDIILEELNKKALALDVVVKDNDNLLKEIVGLVEYPVLLYGSIPEKFMSLPKEVIVTSLQIHQKYLASYHKNGKLSQFFFFVSNILPDYAKAVIHGNQKVLLARLSDALYFYENDLKKSLYDNLNKLKALVFHSKLGSMFDKSLRVKAICKYLVPQNHDLQIAAELCKADLVSEMVYEFPELQGIMGKYYALNQGLKLEIAQAIERHYFPMGLNGEIPTEDSALLAIADKTDSLVSLYSVGERATSSKDPFALKRYAFGIVRIVFFNELNINLLELIRFITTDLLKKPDLVLVQELYDFIKQRALYLLTKKHGYNLLAENVLKQDIGQLFDTKLKFDIGREFLISDCGIFLMNAYKRMSNLLKKENGNHIPTDKNLFVKDSEKFLYTEYKSVVIPSYVTSSDLTELLKQLGKLSQLINDFFEEVMINDENIIIKNNRYSLLNEVKALFDQVLNFDCLVQ